MTSRHDRNKFTPSPNAPNPAKFLKEMEALIPKLKAKGVIPMTREEARAQGSKGTRAAAFEAQVEHERRLGIISTRLDEYMKALTPFAFKLAYLTGWTWIFRFLGYSYKMEGTKETVQGVPDIACTRIYVMRQRIRFLKPRVVKAERLVWEEPKPPKDAPKPKSKIVYPGKDFEGKPHPGIILP